MMRFHALCGTVALTLTAIAPGCNIYDSDLLGGALGGPGNATGGTEGDGDGDTGTGATVGDGDATGGLGGETGSGGDTSAVGGSGPGGGGPTYELIDDMEDDNQFILFTAGRSGRWDAYNDGTGSQVPSPGFTTMSDVSSDPPHPGSDHAAHTSGSGFTVWGAVLDVLLEASGSYDASGYVGLRFWAKTAPDMNDSVHLRLVTTDTDPRGGVCQDTDNTMTATFCFDHFLTQLSLSETWTRHEVYFEDLSQTGAGMSFPSVALDGVYQIEFVSPGTTGGDPFEFWIDDLEFILE